MELPTYTKQWHNDVYPDINASRPELSARGKRVVITGGAGGIGAATAEAFAVAGAAEVIILGRTEKTLEATKSAITSKYPNTNVVAIVTNIADSGSTTDAFSTIAKRGIIDIYINNAAYLNDLAPISAADTADWWRSLETNVKGSLLAIHAVLKNVSKNGVIINVTSGAAHVSYIPLYSAYATGKIASTKLFEYVQSENPDLRVFNLQPGIIESTGMATKAAVQSGFSFPQQDTRTYKLPSHLVYCFPNNRSGSSSKLHGLALFFRGSVSERKIRLGKLGCGGNQAEETGSAGKSHDVDSGFDRLATIRGFVADDER